MRGGSRCLWRSGVEGKAGETAELAGTAEEEKEWGEFKRPWSLGEESEAAAEMCFKMASLLREGVEVGVLGVEGVGVAAVVAPGERQLSRGDNIGARDSAGTRRLSVPPHDTTRAWANPRKRELYSKPMLSGGVRRQGGEEEVSWKESCTSRPRPDKMVNAKSRVEHCDCCCSGLGAPSSKAQTDMLRVVMTDECCCCFKGGLFISTTIEASVGGGSAD